MTPLIRGVISALVMELAAVALIVLVLVLR